MKKKIDLLTNQLSPYLEEIANHPLYGDISSLPRLRLFMQEHVFAVWDFMCLLKELYRSIVSISAPWSPPKDPLSAHLIGSILTEEEGDLTENGTSYTSHYDLYLSAMAKIGADSHKIQQLQCLLQKNTPLGEALDQINVKPSTQQFVLTTFSFFESQRPHELAAAFVYGREGITGKMFAQLITQLKHKVPEDEQAQLTTVLYYFNRHIELDEGEHYPKAIKMLSNLIGGDQKKWQEAKSAAIKALQARINFLAGIHGAMITLPETVSVPC